MSLNLSKRVIHCSNNASLVRNNKNALGRPPQRLNVSIGHKLESDTFWSHAAIFLVANFPGRIFVQVGEVRIRINHGVVLRDVRVRALVEKSAVN